MLDRIVQDVRHAARGLRRTPVFSLTAILSLAIGLGATTAIFSLVNTLLLTSPPGLGEPDRLVYLGRTQDGNGFDNFSYLNFVDYRDRNTTLSGLAAMSIEPRNASLAGPNGGEAIDAGIVGGNWFAVLRARPALGRFFLPEEDVTPRSHAVTVLSHRFWQRRFNGDSSIVGTAISINGQPFTVVGVAAEGFHGTTVLRPDLWVPVMATPWLGMPDELTTRRTNVWMMAVGRLKDGVGLTQANADFATIGRQLEQAYPQENEGMGARILPATLVPGEAQQIVTLFMAFLLALTGLVLAIAGTNVAGMLLARAAARRREIALRLAIGAGRGRIVQQLLTESVLLFVLASALGIVIARGIIAGLMSLVPTLPAQVALEPRLDWRVFGFALAVALVAGIAAGLAPALQSTKPALTPALHGGTAGGRRLRLRSGLLVAQMTLSMVLLAVAGLFGRALVRARTIDPGFVAANLQVASLDLQLANYDDVTGLRFAERLAEGAAAIPGVTSVALTRMVPLDGGGFGLGGIDVPGREPPDRDRGWGEDWNIVSPAYFETMGMPIVTGRAFTDADRAGGDQVAVINQVLAERIWPGEDAVGKVFLNDGRPITVVGVARTAKYRSLGESPRAFVYRPLAQQYNNRLSLVVRHAEGVAVGPSIRRLVADLDPSLPILVQQSMEEAAAIGLFPQRVALWVAASLGGVALLLAVIGIYGVTAYGVTQRTREIGIRIALGSQRADVLRLVLRQGVWLGVLGVGIGVVAALGAARLLASLLYGVPGADLVALGGAGTLLLLASLVASWYPARRASRVDPLVALRSE